MTIARPNPVSSEKLAHTIGRNTVFGVIARVAQVSTRLVTVPAVIVHLGLGGYGIWSIIMTCAAYMRFGSIGIKSAFQKYVAEATGNGNFERANRLLSTGCAMILLVSVIGLVPVALFANELAKLAGVPPEFLASAAHSFTMLAIIMVISNAGAVFEAIVLGGHRIDLARNFTTLFAVFEAVAIVLLLRRGFGLFAMASVMAISELAFIMCCRAASRKVVPEIHIRLSHLTRGVVGELLRFGGSYQLASILQVLYLSIVPITMLRAFGAEAAGIYALTNRLAASVLLLPDALLVSILSGAAMVFAAGSAAQMKTLINKSFKVTLVLGFFPLAFLAVLGPMIVFAWTGQVASSLRTAFWLVCASAVFQSFSTLGLVLYRATGRVLLDNIRLLSQVSILALIALSAHTLGFYGVLAGLACAEFFGALFMLFALDRAFDVFRIRPLLEDALRLTGALAIVLAAAGFLLFLPIPFASTPRLAVAIQLATVAIVCLIVSWPALALTKSLTATEGKAIVRVLLRRRRESAQAVEMAG
jgi:O-antigen/teichoic acid export membrane protein